MNAKTKIQALLFMLKLYNDFSLFGFLHELEYNFFLSMQCLAGFIFGLFFFSLYRSFKRNYQVSFSHWRQWGPNSLFLFFSLNFLFPET